MNILLTGASGFIGRNIAGALLAAGHQVVPVCRSEGLDFCRMQAAADWLPQLRGVDAVINCVGIIGETGRQGFDLLHRRAPIALFSACAQMGIRRVVQMSALGADQNAFSAYHLSKRAADDYLRSLDLDWFVLRPSLIYGRGGKSAALFLRLASLPLMPVIGDGQQQLQPVHISDVVATVMHSLGSAEARQTLDIVGTETISFADWLQTLRRAQGLGPGRLLRIPMSLALALVRIGRYCHPLLRAENLHMLQSGYWADGRPLIRFLGRPPRPIEARLCFTDGAPSGRPA